MAEQENKKYKDKDPAFLFYPQAWLEGTAEMTSEERGVYINLLCYQHQKGSLPIDINRLAKLGGEGEEKFMKIWGHIKPKFDLVNSRYVNKKLDSLMGERQSRALKNKINGAFALLIRYSNLSFSQKSELKNKFNFEDFLIYDDEKQISQKVTEWFDKWKESIKDTNKDKDKDINTEGGLGETKSKYMNFKNSLLKQQVWCEEVCMKTNTIIDDIPSMIDNFISHCIMGGETHYTEKEFKSHFRNVCLSKIEIVKPKLNGVSKESIESRMESFRQKVLLYQNQYDKEVLESFFLHFSEPNEDNTLLRLEMEKVFDIPTRLAKWKITDKKFSKNGNSAKHTGAEYTDVARKIWG